MNLKKSPGVGEGAPAVTAACAHSSSGCHGPGPAASSTPSSAPLQSCAAPLQVRGRHFRAKLGSGGQAGGGAGGGGGKGAGEEPQPAAPYRGRKGSFPVGRARSSYWMKPKCVVLRQMGPVGWYRVPVDGQTPTNYPPQGWVSAFAPSLAPLATLVYMNARMGQS